MVFIAELFWWFEIVKPEFVQPRDVQEFKDGEECFCKCLIVLFWFWFRFLSKPLSVPFRAGFCINIASKCSYYSKSNDTAQECQAYCAHLQRHQT